MKNRIIAIVLIIIVLLGVFFILNRNKENNEAKTAIVGIKNISTSVRVDSVDYELIDKEYITNGNFIPEQELIVSAQTPGKVIQIFTKEGSKVKAGQTLAIIEVDKLNINVQNAKAAFNNAEADLHRFENAYESGGVTKQQLEKIKLGYENAKANLESAQMIANDANIKSSINGIINSKKIELGSFVGPGTPLFEIVNVDILKLRVNADESQVVNLKLGDIIKIKVSVYPDEIFEGKISFIAPKANKSLNFPVEITVKNNVDNELRAGMYGTAIFNISTDSKTPTLVAPRNAFVGSISSNTVFVVKDSIVELRKVISGKNYGDKVEIKEGLKAGEIVVISGQINLSDKDQVSIIK